MPLRFHLDENVSHTIAGGLRRHGIDVTTSTDAGLTGASDEAQLRFCDEAGRTIITHDDDMLRLHAARFPHAGIVFVRGARWSPGPIIEHLVLLHAFFESEEMRNHVEFL